MEKITKWTIYLSIYVVPMACLIPLRGTNVWYPQYVAFMALGFLFCSFLIYKVNKPLSFLSVYCLYSYLFIAGQHPRALMCLITAYTGIGLICLVSKVSANDLIKRGILVMALIQIGMVILQVFNIDPFFDLTGQPLKDDTVGFGGSRNQVGSYYSGLTLLMGWFSPLALIPLYFSKCTSAIVGMISGLTAYCLLTKRFIYLVFIALFICVGFVNIDKYDNVRSVWVERMDLNKLTIEQSIEGKAKMDMGRGRKRIAVWNPITGAGIGMFFLISNKTQGEIIKWTQAHIYEHAHNDILEVFFDFGWLGLVLVLIIILDVLFKTWWYRDHEDVIKIFCCVLAMSVASLGIYIIHAPTSYFMFCLLIGMFYAEVKRAKDEEAKSLIAWS